MNSVSKYKSFRIGALKLTLALPLCFLATTAFAGFEWIPASPSRTTASVQDNVLMPDEGGMPQILVPNVERQAGEGWGDAPSIDFESRPQTIVPPASQASLPIPGETQIPHLVTNEDQNYIQHLIKEDTAEEKAWKTQQIDSVNFQARQEQKAQQVQQAQKMAIAAEQEKYEIIEGFGSDIPLALAMRQVIPAQYSFSFGEGVNAGRSVSWNGGEPWNIVLQEMVNPLGLGAKVMGNTVQLSQGGQKAIAQTPMQKELSPRRSSIKDPGYGAPQQDEFADFPDLSMAENSNAPLPLVPGDSALLPMESLPATTAPVQSQGRMRMSEQIARQSEQENIELRMRADDVDMPQEFGIPTAGSTTQNQRPYNIEPYTPPAYTQGSVSEKNAFLGNESRIGNRLKASSACLLYTSPSPRDRG